MMLAQESLNGKAFNSHYNRQIYIFIYIGDNYYFDKVKEKKLYSMGIYELTYEMNCVYDYVKNKL